MGNQCCSYKGYTESINGNAVDKNSIPYFKDSLVKGNAKHSHKLDSEENVNATNGVGGDKPIDNCSENHKEESLDSKIQESEGFSPSLSPNDEKAKRISMESTLSLNYRIDRKIKEGGGG